MHLTDQDRTVLRCTQALQWFFLHYDQRDYSAMLDLFLEDGVWHRAGQALEGRERIRQVLEARPVQQKVMHVVTNIAVVPIDAGQAEARFYISVYRHDNVSDAHQVPVIAGPSMIVSGSAELVADGDIWRLRCLRIVREFEF